MSILKKLFGSRGASKNNLVDRAPRIGGSSLKSVVFRQPGQPAIDVQNLSRTGVGFTTYSFPRPPSVGDEFTGELDFGDRSFKVVLAVRRVNGPIAGCSILSSEPNDFVSDITRRFDIEVAAVKLRTVDSSILKAEPVGQPHFYVGAGDGSELYLVEDGGRLLHFHGSVWGHYFEGKPEGRCTFGELEEKKDKGSRSSGHATATIVHMSPDSLPEKVEIAERFLSHIPGVPEPIRAQLLKRIREV